MNDSFISKLTNEYKVADVKGIGYFIVAWGVILLFGCNSPFVSVDLCIETVPPGASIIVEGKTLGKTPKTIDVRSNDSVTVSLSGYKVETISPKETSAPRTYKFIELKKLHKIYLDYKPRGSKVYNSDDSFLGTTPCEVEMTRGEKTVSVKFPYHEDYIDSFVVTGSGMRTEELVPTVKYFPETYCNITTTPEGASVKSLVACGEKLLGEFDEWGLTPVKGTNSDVMEAKCDRVFFISHESKYPAVLRFRGSINTNLELADKKNINIPDLPDKTPQNLEFKRGIFEDGNQPFKAVFEGNFFKIISTKYFVPVEIIDLRTDKSDISGASWFDERFFIVRFKSGEGDTKYLIYDSKERRRVSFDNFGLYHERNIPGIIRWKEQIPTSPTRVNEFFDIRYSENNDGLFFFLKLYSGAGCWLVIKTDFEISSSQLVDILFQ